MSFEQIIKDCIEPLTQEVASLRMEVAALSIDKPIPIKEAADQLGVCVQTLRRAVHSGEISCVRNGKKISFTKKAIEDYLNR